MVKLLRTLANDSLRWLLVLALSVLVVCPLSIIFLFIPLWWYNNHPSNEWVLIVPVSFFALLLLAGGPAAILLVNKRRKKWLDGVFTPLGLVGKPYLFNWWEYTGGMEGREVNIRFYRGPTLDISVRTGLQTRWGITQADQPGLYLASMANRQPVQLAHSALRNLRVFAIDEPWTKMVLDSQEAGTLLLRLLGAGESWALLRHVILLPGYMRLTLYRTKNLFEYSFTTAEVRQWLEDLSALARLAESFPPPTVTAGETRVEAAARTEKYFR